MLELCVLHRRHPVTVLLEKIFLVLNKLDGSVAVVLVNLAVNSFLN